MRARDGRLSRVRHAIDSSPVRRGVLREEYETFTMFGELPDDDHVAYEVVQQALRGGEEQPLEEEPEVTKRMQKSKLAYHQRERPGAAWPPNVRAFLFDEALFEHPYAKTMARQAIAIEVSYGGDVTNAWFAARHGLPTYGTVGLHVLGVPNRWVQPPYEFQATRLFVRYDLIRSRVPHDDERWFEEQAKAHWAFRRTGQLPEDDLHAEAVLASAEMDMLILHKRGKDVSEAMALFDLVQRREGDEQAQALQKLCEMARAGRLR